MHLKTLKVLGFTAVFSMFISPWNLGAQAVTWVLPPGVTAPWELVSTRTLATVPDSKAVGFTFPFLAVKDQKFVVVHGRTSPGINNMNVLPQVELIDGKPVQGPQSLQLYPGASVWTWTSYPRGVELHSPQKTGYREVLLPLKTPEGLGWLSLEGEKWEFQTPAGSQSGLLSDQKAEFPLVFRTSGMNLPRFPQNEFDAGREIITLVDSQGSRSMAWSDRLYTRDSLSGTDSYSGGLENLYALSYLMPRDFSLEVQQEPVRSGQEVYLFVTLAYQGKVLFEGLALDLVVEAPGKWGLLGRKTLNSPLSWFTPGGEKPLAERSRFNVNKTPLWDRYDWSTEYFLFPGGRPGFKFAPRAQGLIFDIPEPENREYFFWDLKGNEKKLTVREQPWNKASYSDFLYFTQGGPVLKTPSWNMNPWEADFFKLPGETAWTLNRPGSGEYLSLYFPSGAVLSIQNLRHVWYDSQKKEMTVLTRTRDPGKEQTDFSINTYRIDFDRN